MMNNYCENCKYYDEFYDENHFPNIITACKKLCIYTYKLDFINCVWKKVKKGTPVLVRDSEDEDWSISVFRKYNEKSNTVDAYSFYDYEPWYTSFKFFKPFNLE